ncbi:MAG: condensation domain-containing protein, partial [Pyrinomonadaceae bacterium]
MNSNVIDFFPLTPMQQGILFHTLYTPGTPAYFQQIECVLRGPLDAAAFCRAWRQVAARHAALRTGFVWEEIKEPVQIVYRQADLPCDIHDWRDHAPDAQATLWAELLRDERARGFDLASPPLFRLTLARIHDDAHRFAISYHHIILDGWSLPLLLKEAFTCHTAYCGDGDAGELVLAEPPRFRNYVAWLRRQDLDAARRFWQRLLEGFTAPTTLGARTSSSAQLMPEAVFDEVRSDLPPHVAEALQSLARARRLTPGTIFYGAWGLLLSRYTGEPDVVFGVTVSGRMAALEGIEAMVGLLVNTLPVRIPIDGDEVLTEWLQQIQAGQVGARQYEYSPLADIQNWSGVARGQSLFESILVFENYPVDAALTDAPGGLVVEQVKTFERTNYPLTLLIGSRPASTLRLIYDTRQFAPDAVARMLAHLQDLLAGIAADHTQRLSSLRMLTSAERHQLLVEWNDTQADDEENIGCVHQLFEAQAARTPDAV